MRVPYWSTYVSTVHFDRFGNIIPEPVPLTPQLYEAADAKLQRIKSSLCGYLHGKIFPYASASVQLEHQSLCEALRDVERCRQDLKYKYLDLKDSWL